MPAAAPLISRESLQGAQHAAHLKTHLKDLAHLVQSDAALAASLRATLDAQPQAAADGHGKARDVWLFGYGSLIWNPLVHFVEKRVTTVHGFHRKFCLFSRVNRGSPELPGLVLGLDRGGACRGLAYRIAGPLVWQELSLTWRREMTLNSYRALWCPVDIDGVRTPVLTFAIQPTNPSCARHLSHAEVVDRLARAVGMQGSSAEYLFNTVEALRANGIVDRRIEALAREVKRLRDTLGFTSS